MDPKGCGCGGHRQADVLPPAVQTPPASAGQEKAKAELFVLPDFMKDENALRGLVQSAISETVGARIRRAQGRLD
jgi:hypothetical protein